MTAFPAFSSSRLSGVAGCKLHALHGSCGTGLHGPVGNSQAIRVQNERFTRTGRLLSVDGPVVRMLEHRSTHGVAIKVECFHSALFDDLNLVDDGENSVASRGYAFLVYGKNGVVKFREVLHPQRSWCVGS
jgi:hypothetical protein